MRQTIQFLAIFLIALFCTIQTFGQKGTTRIEPPFWWAGMENSNLELLICDASKPISGWKVTIKNENVILKKAHKVDNPRYLFLELEIKAGADLTVPNDLKVKDDGKLTIAGTVTVEDDIEFEDDAVVNITGVLNLCDDDGTEDDNKFDVDNDVVLTGVGIFCMCNSNDDNDYDNNSNSQGSITYNQNCNGPLPIELTKFEGKLKDNNAVEVIWETQSEINNEKFQLQYSVDGKGWNVIDEIQGAGTSNRKHKYSYQHDISEIRNNLIYYRLKNFDYDGKSNNSEIISVELSKTELPSEKTKLSLIALYPNPNLQSDKLILNVNNTQLVQGIEFYSLDGRKEEVKWTISDAESIELNHENISAGLYKVLILGDKVQLQTSLMIINY